MGIHEAVAKGAEALARALRVNRQLGVVSLCGNDIKDEGAVNLCAEVAKTHLSLKALLLEDNFLGDKEIAAQQ